MKRQIDCPGCGSVRTYPELGTAYERRCGDCHAVWDIREFDENENE